MGAGGGGGGGWWRILARRLDVKFRPVCIRYKDTH